MNTLEPPKGCQEIPGFIAEVGESRKLWLRKDGTPTDVWGERGIWPTKQALDDFISKLE